MASPLPHPQEQATLDLRAADLSEKSITLDGTWKMYWQNLRAPDAASEAYFEYVAFPKLWKNTTWKGKPLPSQGYATYELTVLVPRASEPLALRVPDVYCAYRLYVNDELMAHNGVVGTSRAATVPYWSTQVIDLPATDTLRLSLQVANFHHTKGGPYKSIKLGHQSTILQQRAIDNAFDFFLAGSLFMGGIFFLGLFLFGRYDTSPLYFSLFCLLYSYRIGGARDYAFHALFPNIPWTYTLHAEYLTLFLSIAMFVLYTRSLYPEDTNQKFTWLMSGICFLFSFITIITPPRYSPTW